jgi:hypothetical protein
MSLGSYGGDFLVPGMGPTVESIAQDLTEIYWGRLDQMVIGRNATIDGSSRDVGNTGYTDRLRPGLLLTKDVASGDGDKYLPWGSDTDLNTDLIEGVLLWSMKMQANGTDTDRYTGLILIGGNLKSRGIIIPGETAAGISGHAQETNVRTQCKFTFRMEDDPFAHLATDS